MTHVGCCALTDSTERFSSSSCARPYTTRKASISICVRSDTIGKFSTSSCIRSDKIGRFSTSICVKYNTTCWNIQVASGLTQLTTDSWLRRNTSHYFNTNRCAARGFLVSLVPSLKLAQKGVRGRRIQTMCPRATACQSQRCFYYGPVRASVARCTYCLFSSSRLAVRRVAESWLQYSFYPPAMLRQCTSAAFTAHEIA